MTVELTPFDAAEYLTVEGQRELLTDAVGSNDLSYLTHAMNVILRAQGMEPAPGGGNDHLVTFLKLLKALDMQIEPRAEGEA